MLLLGIFIGILLSIGGNCVAFKYLKYLKKKFAPPSYPVIEFYRQPQNGIYRIDFALGDNIYQGYSKKCPPLTSPENLQVSIRNYSTKRRLYRVFWREKNRF